MMRQTTAHRDKDRESESEGESEMKRMIGNQSRERCQEVNEKIRDG